MNSLWLVVIGMAAVTYIPRVLPLLFFKNMQMPPRFRRFLSFIPCSVLACLIFPGVLTASGHLLSSMAGAAAALFFAWRGLSLIFVVAGSIMAVFITEQILQYL